MLVEGLAFVGACCAAPLVLVFTVLLFALAALQAAPLALWRSVIKRCSSKPSSLRVGRGRDGPYDLPYLRATLDELPALALGLSALFTMISDERVALAVNAHSTYAQAPIRRLMETLSLVYSLTMNNEAKSKAAAKYIAAKHAHIQGPGYSAESQSAQLWVWATLVDALEEGVKSLHPESALVANADVEKFLDELYKDWTMFGVNFGLEEDRLPSDRTAFVEYFKEAQASLVPVNKHSVALAEGLLAIPQKFYLLPLYPFSWYFKTLAIARMSPEYRQYYPPYKEKSLAFSATRRSFEFLWWNQAHPFRHGVLWALMRLGYRVAPDPTRYKKG